MSECPWCGEDSGLILSWSTLGDDGLECQNCHKLCEHEGDYVAESSWGWWLRESDKQIGLDCPVASANLDVTNRESPPRGRTD